MFFDEKKKQNLPIIQASLQFHGIVLKNLLQKNGIFAIPKIDSGV